MHLNSKTWETTFAKNEAGKEMKHRLDEPLEGPPGPRSHNSYLNSAHGPNNQLLLVTVWPMTMMSWGQQSPTVSFPHSLLCSRSCHSLTTMHPARSRLLHWTLFSTATMQESAEDQPIMSKFNLAPATLTQSLPADFGSKGDALLSFHGLGNVYWA